MGSGGALRPPAAAAKLDLNAPVSPKENISSFFLLDVVVVKEVSLARPSAFASCDLR